MKIKCSIIITLFNSKKYLNRLIKSMDKFDKSGFEIIMVDDGSTDNTYSKVQKIKMKNLKIIHKKNGGVSSARNIGLNNSNGDYILFLDGDDWLDENLIEVFNYYYKFNYDLIKFGFIFTDLKNNKNFEIVDNDTVLNKNNIGLYINYLLESSNFNSASNQFIKRKLLFEKNINFTLNRKYAEDFEFNLKLFNSINSGIILKKCYYYYYINPIGTTQSYNKENILKCLYDSINVYIPALDEYKENNGNSITYKQIVNRICNEITCCYKKIYNVNNIKLLELDDISQKIYNDKNILKLINVIKLNKIKLKGFINKIFFNKKIQKYNRIILFIYKIINK